jgi:hypothetical protein
LAFSKKGECSGDFSPEVRGYKEERDCLSEVLTDRNKLDHGSVERLRVHVLDGDD